MQWPHNLVTVLLDIFLRKPTLTRKPVRNVHSSFIWNSHPDVLQRDSEHTKEYYAAIKGNELLTHTTTWNHLWNILQSEKKPIPNWWLVGHTLYTMLLKWQNLRLVVARDWGWRPSGWLGLLTGSSERPLWWWDNSTESAVATTQIYPGGQRMIPHTWPCQLRGVDTVF